ncbi:hypothetical protein [Escherichia coli]|uniref:hypothetical protein n=1 Tax=Escherichia coli TaxID=562 RepID=UPI0031BA0674
MQVWQLWIIAVWSNQAVPIHYDNKAAPAAFFAGPPGGVGLNTGRAARKKAHFFDFIVIIIMFVSDCF